MTLNLQSIETPTAILLPIVRGSNRRIIFTTYESVDSQVLYTDLVGAQVLFELKKKKDPQATNLFTKATANNGGSDAQLKVDSSSTMSIYLDPVDTTNLSQYVYWGFITIVAAGGDVGKVWIQIPFE